VRFVIDQVRAKTAWEDRENEEPSIDLVREGQMDLKILKETPPWDWPVLEHADTDGFEDPDDVPISEGTFHSIQESLRRLYMDANVPKIVRPQEAGLVLVDLTDSDDEDIVEAAYEAMAIAEGLSGDEFDDPDLPR
jgi:uncharacterized protein (UPF0147 family)